MFPTDHSGSGSVTERRRERAPRVDAHISVDINRAILVVLEAEPAPGVPNLAERRTRVASLGLVRSSPGGDHAVHSVKAAKLGTGGTLVAERWRLAA